MSERTTLDYARGYLHLGWSVIPLKHGPGDDAKRPALESWKEFQERRPTPAELEHWFSKTDFNIAVVAGPVSGLLILDVDSQADVAGLSLPPTPCATTGRGSHYYYALPAGCQFGNGARLDGRHLDVRCQGGYVVAPPSIHPSGKKYEWAIGPKQTPLAPPPAWLSEFLVKRSETKPAELGDIDDDLPERFAIMLDQPEHEQLLAAWEGRRKPKTDQSRSGFDLMMSALCLRAGLTEAETASVLLRYKFGKARERGSDYISLTIGKAREGLEQQRVARGGSLGYEWMSAIERGHVSWLWKGRIPAAKLSIIDGDPDVGKTLIWIDLASRITRGDVMPDGSPGLGPAVVVYASAEDDPRDTMRPRFDSAGADVSKIAHLVDVVRDGQHFPLVFPDSIGALRDMIRETKAVAAFLDPAFAFLGGTTDSHKDASIRAGMLTPLAALAEETACAVVLVRHLNKSQLGRAIHRGGGSIAVSAAMRGGLVIAEHRDNPDLRVAAPHKHNLSVVVPSLAFRIVSSHEDPEVPRIQWGDTVDVSADELLQASAEDKGAVREAREFLEQLLTDGPLKAKKIFADARGQHISEKTLRRAKQALGVTSKQLQDAWWWSLP